MLRLRLDAPFAVCRTFAAGWYRPTAAFLTPSAAYGLLLNAAAIESRLYEHDPAHDGRVPASLTRPGLPRMRIALGSPADEKLPMVQSLFQQLHNYPIGAQAGVPAEMAMGNKNNISPVRREILTGLKVIIAVAADPDTEDRVTRGLRGAFNAERYGLPFVGDNQFLPDRFEVDRRPGRVRWYRRVSAAAAGGAGRGRHATDDPDRPRGPVTDDVGPVRADDAGRRDDRTAGRFVERGRAGLRNKISQKRLDFSRHSGPQSYVGFSRAAAYSCDFAVNKFFRLNASKICGNAVAIALVPLPS